MAILLLKHNVHQKTTTTLSVKLDKGISTTGVHFGKGTGWLGFPARLSLREVQQFKRITSLGYAEAI